MKTIVVSGCTRGIGRAVCDLFADQGFQIAGYARNSTDLEQMNATYKKQYPDRKFILVQADGSVKSDVLRFADEVTSQFGKVDVVVNNAGTYLPGSIMNEPDGLLEQLLNLNLMSAYHLTRHLGYAPSAHIFTICSIASLHAYPGGASYTISKFALLGFSRQLRLELQPQGIRVTAILPGAVRTESWNGTDLPDSRFIQPSEIAKTIYSAFSLSSNTTVDEILIRPQQGDI